MSVSTPAAAQTSSMPEIDGTAPDTSHFVGSGQSLQINVTQTTQFWAQIVNNCGSANSRTATIPPGTATVKATTATVTAQFEAAYG